MLNNLLKLLLTAFLVLLLQVIYPQSFTDIRAGLTGVAESSASWMDTDRDGDLDILVSGEFYQGNQPKILSNHYRNIRNDKFNLAGSGIPDFFRGDFSIGDFDLDGIADIAFMGELKGGRRIATIYKGTGNGTFIPTNINFTPVRDGSIHFGDFDGDGDLDVLVAGESENGPVTQIYRNDRNNRFTLIQSGLPGIRRGVARWIDFNLNGQLDVFITGLNAANVPVSILFENKVNGFVALNTGIIALKNSNVAFGDFDNDGDPDILILGETQNGRPTTQLYRNNRNGNFAAVATPFANVTDGFADWGDMDLDGDLDLLISGQSVNGPVSKVYLNERNAGFSDLKTNIIPLYNSSGQWGDYDLDGDLDILIAGLTNDNQFVAKVYRNNMIEEGKAVVATESIESMWILTTPDPERVKPQFYFVYSSSYSDLNQSGVKDYHAFVGPVKKFSKHYVMQEKFNDVIMQSYPTWPKIDQGNIIQNGFATKQEADRSRARIINEYTSKGFKVVEINW
ncbi:MAG: VCBS repeat-containing protein [Bacteroidales bacterium]|nr:VCBS repeat-containing protein [Bacteroidales bacterium]